MHSAIQVMAFGVKSIWDRSLYVNQALGQQRSNGTVVRTRSKVCFAGVLSFVGMFWGTVCKKQTHSLSIALTGLSPFETCLALGSQPFWF